MECGKFWPMKDNHTENSQIANPAAYVDKPPAPAKLVVCRSRIMEGSAMAYEDAVEAMFSKKTSKYEAGCAKK